MEIALLSGAYQNSGDYLIEQRARSLLHYVYPDSCIKVILRKDLAARASEVNVCDLAVFAGGPIYMRKLEEYLPLDCCKKELTVPLSVLGGGWYGPGAGNNQICQYRFSRQTQEFFERIDARGGILSVRDWMTYEILRSYGFQNVHMTGCPAWYEIPLVSLTNPVRKKDFHNIVISNPALKQNYGSCFEAILYLRKRYPFARLLVAFHRGIPDDGDALDFLRKLKGMEIPYVDMAGSAEGFFLYEKCDLHIGYRVHAHIYCMSMRIRSLLIEEDGRGAGVDQALGLPSLHAYSDAVQPATALGTALRRRMPGYRNPFLVRQLAASLDRMEEVGDACFQNAYRLQGIYFERMISTIQKLEDTVNNWNKERV